MRDQRDNKMYRISELQTNNQQVKSQELSHQLLQLQSANKETVTRKAELEALRKQRDAAKIMVTEMATQVDTARTRTAVQMEAAEKAGLFSNSIVSNSVSSGNALPTLASAGNAAKYRALFEFNARSEDELSFQPGDVILVFESHAAEPGWKAGQIRDKVGWFPEAFAEPIAPVHSTISQVNPIQNMPPNVTPSPSLDRIPEDTVIKSATSAKETTPQDAVKVICSCVAQFPWKARNEGDLSFAKGDIIEIVEQQEMKWRGRKADGSIGWFPKSYVKPVFQVHFHTLIKTIQWIPYVCFSVAVSKSLAPSVGWYVAMFNFDAVEPTDLSLKVGDRIMVFERKDDWWRGRCNGHEGIFPANYVQKCDTPTGATIPILCRARAVADFEATAANQLSLRAGDVVSVREKTATGWWEGEMQRGDQICAGWFPGDYVTPISVNTATALFDYEAGQSDELSFRAGDVIIVEKKDADWWAGHKLNSPNLRGLFPANYVQMR
ncbi:unnamed protein product [Angiostrongylus costaricensis]|uniref:Intersectin-1 n=1 Tax=Angiostrongylus costaricensis TaxID=334426 RepID=A0A0R3PDU5_ANGCS|nr:unnamed protein product [Angiostrongylus costaricensis]